MVLVAVRVRVAGPGAAARPRARGYLRLTRGPLRGFLLALLAVNVVSTLAFLLYAAVGIDILAQYIGYFYWSAPLVMVLIIVVAVVEAFSLRARHRTWPCWPRWPPSRRLP